jgi:hypothetical protein
MCIGAQRVELSESLDQGFCDEVVELWKLPPFIPRQQLPVDNFKAKLLCPRWVERILEGAGRLCEIARLGRNWFHY